MAESEVGIGKLLLTEYERLKDEQKTRIGFRDNLIYATLASMAGVITAVLSVKGHANLLLLLPPVSTVLGWTYLVNDEKVSAIGRYIRRVLGPRLAELAAEPGNGAVFGWEIQHRADSRRISRKVGQVAVDLGTFCVPAVVAVLIFWVNGPLTPAFIGVSVAELVVVSGLAGQMIRYADLGRDVSG